MRNLTSSPRLLALACAAVISVSLAGVANASTYDYVFSAGSYSAVGTLTTGATAFDGGFLITDMTGSFSPDGGVSEYALTLAPLGTFPQFNDNLLFYPGNPPYLDFNGLAFDADGEEWNVFYATTAEGGDNAYVLFIENESFVESFDGSFTVAPAVSATPLPATLPLLAGGLCIIGFLAHRRKRPNSMLAT